MARAVSRQWLTLLADADRALANDGRRWLDAEELRRQADEIEAELKTSAGSRDNLIEELALERARAEAYRAWAWALHDAMSVFAPVAEIGRQHIEGSAKAVDARLEAVAGRVKSSYGEVAAAVAREVRAKSPECSRAAIVREIRTRKDAGNLPDTRLPANDRTIEVQLRRMGF